MPRKTKIKAKQSRSKTIKKNQNKTKFISLNTKQKTQNKTIQSTKQNIK